MLASLMPTLFELIGKDRLLAPDADSSRLRLWEEFNRDKVTEYAPETLTKTLAELNIISGDIFCVAEQLDPAVHASISAAWHADQQSKVLARRKDTAGDRATNQTEPYHPTAPTKAYITKSERQAAELKDGVPPRPRFFDTPDALLRAHHMLFRVRACVCGTGPHVRVERHSTHNTTHREYQHNDHITNTNHVMLYECVIVQACHVGLSCRSCHHLVALCVYMMRVCGYVRD